MKKWQGIVIHCSDSNFGDALVVDGWHKQRDWSGIGYNFVITNGKKTSKSAYLRSTDGAINSGRALSKDGSHALGYNDTHIGICLIGVKEFTELQFSALQMLIKELVDQYSIELENIIGHYQCTTAHGKTCPNFDVDVFKNKIFE